jgi:hypothetical protein
VVKELIMQYFTEEEVYTVEEGVSYQEEVPLHPQVAFPLEEVAYAFLEEPSYLEEEDL